MTTVTRQTNLRSEVIRADPEWPRTSRVHAEYEFPAPAGARKHRNVKDGKRVFEADYQARGAYADE